MKYVFLAFLGIALLVTPACKTQTANVPLDPYLNVNVDHVRANCTPAEQYSFPVFGVYAMPARTKNCAGVDDLWFVAWPGENTEKEQTIAKLLTIMYVESENSQKDPDIKTTFIKYSTSSDNNLHAAFYEITEVPVKNEEPEQE